MSIVVTGATGHFGRLIVEALRRQGVPGEEIIANSSLAPDESCR